MNNTSMNAVEAGKKIFLLAGELSGDKVAAWYLNKTGIIAQGAVVDAIGGDGVQAAGARLYERFERLNLTGIVEIVRRLPFIVRFLRQIADHIIKEKYSEVILVDFPGFNMRLARMLKQRAPSLKITYLSPPQLWCWGAWRITSLKKYTDQIIVLYPFEVEWYRQRGVHVSWIASPVYERLQPYFDGAAVKKKRIAVIPGSRKSEFEMMFPIFASLIKKIMIQHPDVEIIIPRAESLPTDFIEQKMIDTGLTGYRDRIMLVTGEEAKLTALSSCALAITKPGTVTLELALLLVPTVMIFKTSWINYYLARPLVKVKQMALPNLLMKDPIYKEFLQHDCKEDLIFAEVGKLFNSFLVDDTYYRSARQNLARVRNQLLKT